MPGLGGRTRAREWGRVRVGLGGRGVDVAPARVQNWAAMDALPPKTERCGGVASRRTGFALGWTVPGEMGLFGMISNEAGVHPPASSNFIWTSLFSSPRFAPPQPLLPPSLPSQVVWEGSSRSHYVESISRGLWRLLLP